ncbi:MAG: hypothetical protein LBH96_04565 [Candidatus Peribacteria bacterium]|nr:hypothetical protein [Candidatus Peribacteria bacterium]
MEKHNETSEEEEHLLQRSFNKATQKLEVFVDEVILYEEKVEEKVEEENQRTQILEKLNKF